MAAHAKFFCCTNVWHKFHLIWRKCSLCCTPKTKHAGKISHFQEMHWNTSVTRNRFNNGTSDNAAQLFFGLPCSWTASFWSVPKKNNLKLNTFLTMKNDDLWSPFQDGSIGNGASRDSASLQDPSCDSPDNATFFEPPSCTPTKKVAMDTGTAFSQSRKQKLCSCMCLKSFKMFKLR